MTIKPSAIDELVAAGKYDEAAALAERAGDTARATELYERIWEFAAASRCARAAGLLDRALRNAIDARDEPLVAELAAELGGSGEPGLRQLVDVYSQRRRFAAAGLVAEELGDRDLAIDLYQRGHIDLDAARLLEEAGRDREAGRLLERVVDHGDEGEAVSLARLRLGLLLARRMQHDEAARYLQEAARDPATRERAQPALVVELAALGLRDAARDVLMTARTTNPDLPVDVDQLISNMRRDLPSADKPRREVDIIAGRYRLGPFLGSGGCGRVFRARDEVTGNNVAIKLFDAGQARTVQAYERFAREARVAGALRHPNLVELYDFSAEQSYAVMELMVGGSLAERLSGPMEQSAVRRMALDVLAGLALAHQRGIIHRDVKPANIFFDARGTAKLGDFGVAHLLDLGQTQTGGLIGTLAYMAPEQITGARLTITADLYGFGIALFEALTGRLPFLGPDFVAQHLGEPPPPPRTIVASLAPEWDEIIARLLAKDPGARYESIDDLRRDITGANLGSAAPKPLLLPRARADSVSPHVVTIPGDEPDAADSAPRYQFETPLGRTEFSQISRALDTALNRSVIIERYTDEAVLAEVERRLYILARGGGPFVQRALAYDRQARCAVFEAPAGTPFGEAFAETSLARLPATRLLARLARGVAPLHEVGAAHGAISATSVVVDEAGHPTILVCGLALPTRQPSPAGDAAEILALIARALHHRGEPSPAAVIAALAPELADDRRAQLTTPVPATGEALFAVAAAIEINLLELAPQASQIR